MFYHVELLCRADGEQRWTPVSTLPCALHVGPSERNPMPVEVNDRPTWQAFDQCESFPAVHSLFVWWVHHTNNWW